MDLTYIKYAIHTSTPFFVVFIWCVCILIAYFFPVLVADYTWCDSRAYIHICFISVLPVGRFVSKIQTDSKWFERLAHFLRVHSHIISLSMDEISGSIKEKKKKLPLFSTASFHHAYHPLHEYRFINQLVFFFFVARS